MNQLISGVRGAPWVNKSGNISIQKNFGFDVGVRAPPEEEEGSPRVENAIFSWREIALCCSGNRRFSWREIA